MKGRLEKAFMALASLWGILRLITSRPRVIVFGTDMIGEHRHEPRMSEVYHWLESRRIPYTDLVHATPGAHVVRHWFQRRRPTIYLEGLRVFSQWLLPWVLCVSSARHLWAIDDYRTWPGVITAAREVGLSITLFQHGRFNRHMPYLALPAGTSLPDRYIVWNEYWRDKLLALSPLFAAHPEIVFIGGKPSAELTYSPVPVSTGGSLEVVVVHEPAMPPGKMQYLLDTLLSLQGVHISYKVRSNQSAPTQLESLGLQDYPARGVIIVSDIPARSQLVLGSYSTLLYEAIARGLPVGVVVMSSTEADDLVADGLAAPVDLRTGDVMRQITHAADIPASELARRAKRLAVVADIGDTLQGMLYSHL